MSHISVHSERIIDAKPEDVFAALADYEQQRPRILPPNFLNYRVEKGGKGKGTIINYILHAGGRERAYQMQVDEPQRGQTLTERDKNSSLITRWSVRPDKNGRGSKVSVVSDWEGSNGVNGLFERTFAPLGLRNMYRSMLQELDAVMHSSGQDRKIMKVERKNPQADMRVMLVIAGSVLALAAGANYLVSRRSA